MKKYLLRFVPITIIAVAVFTFTACEDEEEDCLSCTVAGQTTEVCESETDKWQTGDEADMTWQEYKAFAPVIAALAGGSCD